MKKQDLVWLFTSVVVLVIIIDQITKLLISKYIPTPINIIPNFFRIIYTTNKGIIFGFLQNYGWLPLMITLLILLIIIYFYDQLPPTKTGQILWGMIVGGAAGNLIDRLLHGFVIDFISLNFWPAFNIADSAITIGIIGLIIYLWKN